MHNASLNFLFRYYISCGKIHTPQPRTVAIAETGIISDFDEPGIGGDGEGSFKSFDFGCLGMGYFFKMNQFADFALFPGDICGIETERKDGFQFRGRVIVKGLKFMDQVFLDIVDEMISFRRVHVIQEMLFRLAIRFFPLGGHRYGGQAYKAAGVIEHWFGQGFHLGDGKGNIFTIQVQMHHLVGKQAKDQVFKTGFHGGGKYETDPADLAETILCPVCRSKKQPGKGE